VSVLQDGTVVCDRCGGDVGNGSITDCVIVTALTTSRDIVAMHFCLVSDDTHERCATRVLTAKATADLVRRNGDEPVQIHQPVT
jgi:hypothetical protein